LDPHCLAPSAIEWALLQVTGYMRALTARALQRAAAEETRIELAS
jgi:hypothetical protein